MTDTQTGHVSTHQAEEDARNEQILIYVNGRIVPKREALVSVHEAICRKIGWNPGAGDERAFLEAYYPQLRARLEAGMRMGKRKASKYAADS